MHLTERRHINQNKKHTDIFSYRRFTNSTINMICAWGNPTPKSDEFLHLLQKVEKNESEKYVAKFPTYETDPKDFFLKTLYFGCKFICRWWLLWVTCFTALKCNACRLNPFVVQVFFIMDTENFWGWWGIYNSNVLQL